MAINKAQTLYDIKKVSDNYNLKYDDEVVVMYASLKTIYLPLLASVPIGKIYRIYAIGLSDTTLERTGSDIIKYTTSNITSFTSYKIRIVSNGDYWVID